MFDFPTILCCFNYANIYCLEVTCLISTTSIFPLTLIGIINIKWGFIDIFCQILFCNIYSYLIIKFVQASKNIPFQNNYKYFCIMKFRYIDRRYAINGNRLDIFVHPHSEA